ncbi:DNA replication and repair protein RecF [Geothermobacter ehrlichii]|uniref:DNA replication and repair protein RecF n=1 Tax=Geothermobacter ehrlichii TaxID=213224 RepID=A0A5D3WGS5_9BACT|nr:DNA replication/repair protein RecF [Geothermobacter ehrlichii]TYO97671.1 DNA replication and repair protein RecF [Geothermobacter ehrlichii]
MRLERLVLAGFRNLAEQEFVPGPGINLIWGNNGQGKTNLLEAVYLLTQLKSFRTARLQQLIAWDGESARLSALTRSGQVGHELRLVLHRGEKRGFVDGERVRSVADFLGHLQTVLFAPEETALIRGGPAGRRALLDRAIFLTDPAFLQVARDYRRCLEQRNRLLKKDVVRAEELRPWSERLAEAGARLRRARLDFAARIRPHLAECYRFITGGKETADLAFGRQVTADAAALLEELARVEERERLCRQTLAGPHRDEVAFSLDGRPLRHYGSQGQQRSFILAFKCAQLLDYRREKGHFPVLLLDDLTSELDRNRRQAFFAFVRENSGQVFLTTTDRETCVLPGMQVNSYYVEAGRIEPDRP